MDLARIQNKLLEYSLDGWLIYDYHNCNRFAHEILQIPKEGVLTRRFFYWIPSSGEPIKIVHHIESQSLDHLPGKKHLYLSWIDLEQALSDVLKTGKSIAMEYSPRNAIPSVSIVDGGTLEVVKQFAEVKSSADLIQNFISQLDERKIETHFIAEEILKKTLNNAWDLIASSLRKNQNITEYDVQQFILSEFAAYDCITEEGPICAVNENSALPHYCAFHENSKVISKGDFILIDLWCKKNMPYSVYADMTHVGIAAAEPTPHHQEIFEIVRQAQLSTTEFIRTRLKNGISTQGWEVDAHCRSFIEKKGFGSYFLHRTGHSIDTEVHGSGANLDNLETRDTRLLIPGSCFSIEPGIYLPEKFGVRLEYNAVIDYTNILSVTGDVQESIFCLL